MRTFDYLMNIEATYIPYFDFIVWYFKKQPIQGLVLSFLIKKELNNNEPIKANRKYIAENINRSIASIDRALEQLEFFGFIERSSSSEDGTWILLKQDRLNDIYNEYQKYLESQKKVFHR